jgi:hypothetical protein
MWTRGLFSPLPRAECVARIAAIARNESSPLIGSVKEKYFRVGWRYQPLCGLRFRNSFKPYLFGKVREFDGGTMIRCHFTLDPLVLVFTCFFAFGAAVAVMAMHDWTFISALLFILVFGSAVSWGERELIMGRLAAAINARPWTADNAAGGG